MVNSVSSAKDSMGYCQLHIIQVLSIFLLWMETISVKTVWRFHLPYCINRQNSNYKCTMEFDDG